MHPNHWSKITISTWTYRNKAIMKGMKHKQDEQLMKKKWAILNEKIGGKNGCWTFLHSMLLQNDFVFFEECCSMSDKSIKTCKRDKNTKGCRTWEIAKNWKKTLCSISSCKIKGIPGGVGEVVWGILAHPQHEDMHSQTRLEMELLCSCSLTSKVVQCNAMKFTKNLMRCVHLEDTKTSWENCNSPWWNVKGHYVDVHSMSHLLMFIQCHNMKRFCHGIPSMLISCTHIFHEQHFSTHKN